MGWVYKSEQYFEYNHVPQVQRVPLASFHLEGIALQWHRWMAKFQGPLTWEELTKAILLRFGPTDFEDPSEALSRLRQTTTIATYQEEFEKLSHQVDGLPEPFLIICFIAGLRDEIRLDVKIKQPTTLSETMGVARLVEERNHLQRKVAPSYCPQPAIAPTNTNVSTTEGVLGPPPNLRQNMSQNSNVRRISKFPIKKHERGEKKTYAIIVMRSSCRVIAANDPNYSWSLIQMIRIMKNGPREYKRLRIEDQEIIPEISIHAITGTTHTQTRG